MNIFIKGGCLLIIFLLAGCGSSATVPPSTSNPTLFLTATPTQQVYESVRTISPTGTPTVTPFPTPTRPAARQVVDCTLMPILSGCNVEELPIGGKLSIINPETGQVSVVDLVTRQGWQINQPAISMSWSVSGMYLLLRTSPTDFTLYDEMGNFTADFHSEFIRWGLYDTLNMDPRSYYSIYGARAWLDGQIGVGRLFVQQKAGGEIVEWRVPQKPTDQVQAIIDWVPGTKMILLESIPAGNAMWVLGGSLYAVDAETGNILKLNESILPGAKFNWHPTIPGLLLFGSAGNRILEGMQRLTVLNVLTGELTYLTDETVATYTPSWSPDGKLIAFSAYTPEAVSNPDESYETHAIYLMDYLAGSHRQLTYPPEGMVDGSPYWSADGKYLLYTRHVSAKKTIDVRLISLDGSNEWTIVTGLPDPPCYGIDDMCFQQKAAAYWSGK